MIKVILLISIFGFANVTPDQPFWDAHNKKASKELSKWCENYEKVELLKSKDGREYYKILNSSSKEAGSLILTSAKGRYDKFDLMIVSTPSGKIDLIRILKYRSEYGSEITNKKWLAQFYKEDSEEFIFRKNIDAISGATFSARGLTEEINAVRQLIDQVQ